MKIPNFDEKTGIHYGVISQNSIQSEVMSDVWGEARDLTWEQAKDDLVNRIVRALEGDESREAMEEALDHALQDLYYGESRSDEKFEAVAELIEQWTELSHDTPASEVDRAALWSIVEDRFNDTYQGDDHSWLWEKDGYQLSCPQMATVRGSKDSTCSSPMSARTIRT